ncbi:MAG: cysteine desulfurase-like protein [Mesorhizobium sp.]|nr:MAG: cysteine desulfurase-like protein [Mesorhizobium sp.]RWJ23598.1 MAG: cysteine desulfurase-like protein [Mesorhizobium sp.]RWJ88201.1 MAG: cysteine desulfurase-like protein [Mesorhizobium sp.]
MFRLRPQGCRGRCGDGPCRSATGPEISRARPQVPQAVADAVSRCLLTTNVIDDLLRCDRGFEESAEIGADDDFLRARRTQEIGHRRMGANMTTLTYHMSRTLGRTMKPGDEIILTRMDHEGNVSPWLQLAEDLGLVVHWLSLDKQSWQIEEAALATLLTDRTRLVALNYASNLTGSINRVKALTRVAKQTGALVYVDAVQFAPHGLIDVRDIGCDFLICSAYKFFGPHMGILWGRLDVIDRLKPYKCRCSSNALPERFELGTPQIELMAGLTAAVDYFAELGAAAGDGGSRRARIAKAFERSIIYENPLAQRLIDGLSAISGLTIHGITDPARVGERVPTVSFTVDGIVPETIVRQMNAENIFLWSGHNYAWEVVHQLGIPAEQGVVRIGIAHYNTAAEIDETLESVRRVVAMLRQERF